MGRGGMTFEDLPLWMRIWIGIGLLLIILLPLTCLLIGLLDPGMPDDAGHRQIPWLVSEQMVAVAGILRLA